VTAHDGFTLADLVSYNEKHNEANGEQNNDGEQHNNSWNCGEEGSSKDQKVVKLRHRQLRNFATALLVSQGVPMLVMGDEYGHSKGGNNNTYCHDGDINYFQWDVCEKQKGLVRFFQKLIQLRKANPSLRQSAYMDGEKIKWHGVKASDPDWSDSSRLVAFSIVGERKSDDLYVAFNSGHAQVTVELPEIDSGYWDITADTSKPAPFDFLESDDMLSEKEVGLAKEQCQAYLDEGFYPMAPYSSIILKGVVKKKARSRKVDDFSMSSTTISTEAKQLHSSSSSKGSKKKATTRTAAKSSKRAKSSDKKTAVEAAAKTGSAEDDDERESLRKMLEENRKLKALLEKKKGESSDA
jgi:isoamylase